MADKKYQVFISSTYSDLIEERRKILDVLLMADCIPAGMEAFVATDVEQFEVIKKVIDLCDYYVLIIGKRYGSINPQTGISYTEMEYDYAIDNDIPVLVFAIDDSVVLPAERIENNKDSIEKLKKFRAKALNNRLASVWHTTDELTGKLAISIMKAKNEISRPGWQRASDFDEASLRREIMTLEEKNEYLSSELQDTKNQLEKLTAQNDLAFDDHKVEVKAYYYTLTKSPYGHVNNKKHDIYKSVTLDKIFVIIATEMLNISISEKKIENVILHELFPDITQSKYISDDQLIKRILNQFKALDLIASKWSEENKALFWGLTTKGELKRDNIILFRK